MNSNNLLPSSSSGDISGAARLPRRTVLKWFAIATAATQLPGFGLEVAAAEADAAKVPAIKGYGTDPNISGYYQPGEFWPLTLTESQRKAAMALADTILPKDHLGPAASELRVHDYIDEWVSAPYPQQQKDRATLLPGLKWLDDEANKRFKQNFAALTDAQRHAICDDICWPGDAKPEFKNAAAFFVRFRTLAASAYYGTEAGWEAIGYVGNVPLMKFDGPPEEVLKKLDITQTVV